MLKNPYGDFTQEGSAFQIRTPDIPRNWYNYLWNDNYITFVSQTGAGEGFLQDSLGRRIGLISDRGVYLTEGGANWGISGLPVKEKREDFSCVHDLGNTVITVKNRGITSKLCFFVPNSESCELWRLKIKNETEQKRTVTVLGYAGTAIDGPYVRQGYNLSQAEFDPKLNGVISKNYCDFFGKHNIPYYSFMALSEKADGFDASVNAFLGPYGSLAYPLALERGGCSNTAGNAEKLAFALEKKIELAPYEERELIFICAIAFTQEEAEEIKCRYSVPENVVEELNLVKNKFARQIDGAVIDTPDPELNLLFSWLKHQANMGSRWARVRHNGYRDMNSDCECLAAVNPSLALERFKRVLTYQYANGYAPRTIRGGAICDNQFADNMVWIPFTASAILKELGDKKMMDIPVPFNDGTVASIYEHVRRSVEFLYNFRGYHDLIRIWGGDWNDCMNQAGLQGKGVSVWLSIAWYRANRMFGEIARICGREEDARLAAARGEELRNLVEKYGWDGEYYLCAYSDDGSKIGSRECREGKMFLIPQLWAVFSGISKNGREIQAMDAVEKYLSSPLGTLISIPPYTEYDEHIGVITLKPAGVHENGGVYLHTIAWKIAADAMLKRAENVEKDLMTILPFRNPIVQNRAEPYILCNSYFGQQTGYRYGTPGQSWRTAAGPWLEKALISYVFGLMPEMKGLRVAPCLPPSWKRCAITKKFRSAVYHIQYENNGTEISEIWVNGEKISGNLLPFEEKTVFEVTVKTQKT